MLRRIRIGVGLSFLRSDRCCEESRVVGRILGCLQASIEKLTSSNRCLEISKASGCLESASVRVGLNGARASFKLQPSHMPHTHLERLHTASVLVNGVLSVQMARRRLLTLVRRAHNADRGVKINDRLALELHAWHAPAVSLLRLGQLHASGVAAPLSRGGFGRSSLGGGGCSSCGGVGLGRSRRGGGSDGSGRVGFGSSSSRCGSGSSL
mmetsp:Transcript_12914/g.29691  ORF Transcript_12914/g.29691 Transcript_12914/m.29691 type:complete len:210 (-) Transcript_12914:1361-1990(-)